MKKIFTTLLVALCLSNVFAQDINIPDENFLKSLINIGVDINNDGKIQESEAEAITKLELKNSSLYSKFIIDFIGIKSFKNLKIFEYSSVYVTKLDVSNMSNLTSLTFLGGNLEELNISELANLEELSGNYNELHTLTGIKDCKKLTKLTGLGYSKLTSLDVSGLDKLEVLDAGYWPDSNTYLEYGLIKTLNVQGCTSLEELNIMANKITSLDLSGLSNLREVTAWANYLLESIDLTGVESLEVLLLEGVKIKTLDISDSPYLSTLECRNSSLESVDFSNNQFLEKANLRDSKLTSLDVSMLKYLYELDVIGNNELAEVCVESLIRTIEWRKSDDTEWKVCETGVISALSSQMESSKIIVKAYNLQGNEVDLNTKNELIIVLYDDGTTEKVLIQ